MEELVGRYHDAVTRYIHLKVRDKHLADEVLAGVLDQAPDRQAGRCRQEQGSISRLPADRPPPADHRPFPNAQAPAASARRPARCRSTRRRFRPRLARGRDQSGLVAARNLSGFDPQEPLRHRSSAQARLSQSVDRRDRRQARRDDPDARSPPRRFAKTFSAPAPSSSSSWSRNCARRSTRPAPKTSKPRSSTSGWDTSIAGTAIPPRTDRQPARCRTSPSRHVHCHGEVHGLRQFFAVDENSPSP